jgi:Homeodomain-like domain
VLREGDRRRLGDLARLPSVPSGLAKRARVLPLAADGVPHTQIARTVGVSRPTVIGWRERYREDAPIAPLFRAFAEYVHAGAAFPARSSHPLALTRHC